MGRWNAGLGTRIRFTPYPLILNEADGEHLRRRYAEQAAATSPGSIPEFTIRIDKQNGGAEDFVAVTENLNLGATIPFHKHHNAEEILLLEEDGARVTVGHKRASAGPRSIVFIPRETWVSVTNTATHTKAALNRVSLLTSPCSRRISPQDLPKTESLLTLVGGKVVYNAHAVRLQ